MQTITDCPNCHAEFEEAQPIGKKTKTPIECPEDEGGCGFKFWILTPTGIKGSIQTEE